MCLGIPGRISSIVASELPIGKVIFAGIVKDVCLAYVPEAKVGDFVIVHAGFAISIVDPEAAQRTLACLEELGELEHTEPPPNTEGAA